MHFSIITPSFNGARFLREALESVFSQRGDFEVSYRVMDGGSTDGTLEILRDYETRWSRGEIGQGCRKFHFSWTSGPDAGMYDAINRGFQDTEGDVCAWLNTDDLFLPDAFAFVSKTFQCFPEVEWLKGITSYFDEHSVRTEAGHGYLYDQKKIADGFYGRDSYYIQQTSAFWKRSLWEREGPIPEGFRLAGDYALWTRFARTAPLYAFDQEIALFRRAPGQLSENSSGYEKECARIAPVTSIFKTIVIRFLVRVMNHLPRPVARTIEHFIFPEQVLWKIDWNLGNPRIVRLDTIY